ncbi:MAG: pitrilysin family protein [Dehalococcoidia bacterium]|nr:pitrilysin family protein [Dehalococcoidia bacterium]
MYQKAILDNGLRIITGAMSHTRSVCVAIFIGVGSRYESVSESGTSHFIEHLCFRGTTKHPTAREISEAIEGVGGILNAATDKELTCYWCKVTRPHFRLASEVLVDMLLDSKFDPEDIERERQVIVEEINMCKDSPSQQVGMLIDELLWPGHPLGRDIAGTRDSVTGITRDTMLDFLRIQYKPASTVVTVAGDIEPKQVVDTYEKLLGGWSNQRQKSEYLAYEERPGAQVAVETRDTEQAHLCLALPGVSLFHPKRFALDLLNIILGEGMSSRLFSEIRDKLGLAYSIYSYVEHFFDTGSLTVSASMEPGNLPRAVTAILEQLAKLKEIPESELNKAKEISKGRLLLRMEDSRNVAGWLGGQEVLTERILNLDEVVAIVEGINARQLEEMAQEILISERLRLAVVGPVSDKESLKQLLKL